ncbi:MAG: hypothetical protein C0418_02605 [Coriobacteriaceae bacterium]|nr:hypothetical protein [Coriobacteriaceae bacterium]
MADEEQETDGGGLDGRPRSGGVEADEVSELCDGDRDELTAKQTAECAGAELAELYENEEDGGS